MGTSTPALTVRQPHAENIVSGRKAFECRSWSTKHRGRLLVHAASALDSKAARGAWRDLDDELVRGAIVGSVDVVDVYPMLTRRQWHRAGEPDALVIERRRLVLVLGGDEFNCTEQRPFGVYQAGLFAWQLIDPERFDMPRPCVGRLGIWRPA